MRLVILIFSLLFPICAHAAVAIPIIVALYEGYYVYAAIMIAMAVYGAAHQRKAARDAAAAWYAGLRDRTITSVASDNPYVYIYGRSMVGGTIVGLFNNDAAGVEKYAVVVLAAHECDAIEEVYIAGHPVGYATLDATTKDVSIGTYFYSAATSAYSDFVGGGTATIPHIYRIGTATAYAYNVDTGGYDSYPVTVTGTLVPGSTTFYQAGATATFSTSATRLEYIASSSFPTVSVHTHLGTPGDTADATLMSVTPSLWKSTATLSGFCYLVIRLNLFQAEFQTGMPQVTALVRGKKLYDPRTSTTYWSQNPALVAYDYLTSKLCGNIDASDLPVADYIAAANVCDEDHSIDPSLPVAFGKRYTFNGTITADQQQGDSLEAIAQSMAGTIVATTWSIKAGKYVAPVASLYQEDIVGVVGLSPGISDMQLFNGIKGRFSGPENNYAATDFTPYQNPSFLAVDGVAKWTNIDFPFTDATLRIFNLASILIADQRYAYTFKAEFGLKAWPLQVGDRITMTSAVFGWSSKIFRITDKKYSPNSAIELTLKEDDPVIWSTAATNRQVVKVPTIATPPAQTTFTLPTESVIGSVSIIDSIPPVPSIYSVIGTLDIGSTTVYQAGAVVTLDAFTTSGLTDFWCVYEAPGSPVVPAGALSQTNIPNPYAIDAIASITLTSGDNDLLFMSDGTVVSRIRATWPVSTTQSVVSGGILEIQWSQGGSGIWQSMTVTGDSTTAFLSPVKDGQIYQVRIRAVNPVLNAKSDWTYADAHTVLGKSAPPNNVPWFSIAGNTLSWGVVTNSDLMGYVIRYHYGLNRSWGDANPLHDGVITHNPYLPQNFPQGQITLMICALNATGIFSAIPAYIQTEFGDVIVSNVVENFDFKSLGYPGALTGCSVSGGNIVADSVGDFYGADPADFYSQYDTATFWNSNFGAMTYETTIISPSKAAANSNMTLDTLLTGDALFIEYRVSGENAMYPLLDTDAFFGADADNFYGPDAVYQSWPGQITANNLQYQFRFSAGQGPTQGILDACNVAIDVPDIQETFNDIIISNTGTRLPITKTYNTIVNVQLTLQYDGGTAFKPLVVDKNSGLGPLIQCQNSSGTLVSGTVDAVIQGY